MYGTCSLVTGFGHYESRGTQDPNSSPETGHRAGAQTPFSSPRYLPWRKGPCPPEASLAPASTL